MAGGFRFTGKVTVRSNRFPEIARQLPRERNLTVSKFCYDLKARVQGNIVTMGAVRTGAMLNSVYVVLPTGQSDYGVAVNTMSSLNPRAKAVKMVKPKDDFMGAVGVAADYAHWVHDGTHDMAGRPFFREAVEALRSTFTSAMRRAVSLACGR